VATFLSTLVALVAGGVITFLVARHYYEKASSDLKDEAAALRKETARLKRHTTLILRGLEDAGLVEYTQDEQTGEIIAIKIKASASANTGSSASATPTVERGDPPTDPPTD
jgi:hypothetical protein